MREVLLGAKGVDLEDAEAVRRYIQRLPEPLRITAGGNTSCIEFRSDRDDLFILDCGSGLRELGQDLMKSEFARGEGEARILMTHTHWDHIQGLPFFTPAFIRGNKFTVYSPHGGLKERLDAQQDQMYFPWPSQWMQTNLHYRQISADQETVIAGVRVRPVRTAHPGECYAYRLTDGDHSVVYATDAEYYRLDAISLTPYVTFFKNADVLIFDAMFSFNQVFGSKLDWGHSTAKIGAELAFRAGVKRLLLFHHETTATDEQIWGTREEAINHLKYRAKMAGKREVDCEVFVAYEGLEIEL